MEDDDVKGIIMSYVGSTLTNAVLMGIRHSCVRRQIQCQRNNIFLYYDFGASGVFTAVKIIDLCACDGIENCRNPYCPHYGRYVQFVSERRPYAYNSVYRIR